MEKKAEQQKLKPLMSLGKGIILQDSAVSGQFAW